MGEHLQDAEDAIEYTILNRRDVNAFQIPPQASSSGHRAEEWKNCIWSGKIWIAAKNNNCIVRLIKPATEEIFLQSVIEGGDHDRYVERTVDSSRYFVLRVVHPQTKKAAFIGLGFEERNDAFDFNCCLSDFKNRNVESEKAEEAAKDRPPPKDYSLKEGEKITRKMVVPQAVQEMARQEVFCRHHLQRVNKERLSRNQSDLTKPMMILSRMTMIFLVISSRLDNRLWKIDLNSLTNFLLFFRLAN
ncbi:unnamed protein product [Amoebophrya sp. A25]|nr:unnamed protein product [Amoebophrya sp. A25]|eukprot:GSA25T00005017001.1